MNWKQALFASLMIGLGNVVLVLFISLEYGLYSALFHVVLAWECVALIVLAMFGSFKIWERLE